MADDLSVETITQLQQFIVQKNYTQFYATLYANGSTVSGLYIPGPTGQGLFGNYSHIQVSSVVGRELFDAERELISTTIAQGLLAEILENPTGSGGYRLLTDVEFLTKEISIFTDDLGFPTEAYPGHDMIDLMNLDVPNATEGLNLVEASIRFMQAFQASETKYIIDFNGNFLSESDAANAGIVFVLDSSGIAGHYYDAEGNRLDWTTGIFTYNGNTFGRKDLIQEDGVLYIITDMFSSDGHYEKVPVGLTPTLVVGLLAGLDSPASCFLASTPITMSDGSTKPIEQIKPDDQVLSYNAAGELVPSRVVRTMSHNVKHILDFFGLFVTPGHVFLCGGGKFKGRHVPLIDILRSDGGIVQKDGTIIRAATGDIIGSDFDKKFVWAVTGDLTPAGTVKVTDRQKLRLGTRVVTEAGNTVVLGDILQKLGAVVTLNGMVKPSADSDVEMPFHWRFSSELPKPEDYVLQRSQLTLEEIYSAAEWEAVPPQMPVPYSGEAGPSFKDTIEGISDGIPPNVPLNLAAKHFPAMNRKQRKGFEARARKFNRKGVVLVI